MRRTTCQTRIEWQRHRNWDKSQLSFTWYAAHTDKLILCFASALWLQRHCLHRCMKDSPIRLCHCKVWTECLSLSRGTLPSLGLIQNRREMNFLLHPAGHIVWTGPVLAALAQLPHRLTRPTAGATKGSDPVQQRGQRQAMWLSADRKH